MGTRGAMGFAVDGELKVAYNHFDSYPSYLGQSMVAWAGRAVEDLDVVREKARALTKVDDGVPATDDQRARCVAERAAVDLDAKSWYGLLRATQGDPGKMLAVGFYEDASSFPLTDSLFCEWAYVVDLDTEMLEVYEGFQREPHTSGRFAEGPESGGYWPCKLVAAYPLRELPADLEEALARDGVGV